jgi:hypothetical protein
MRATANLHGRLSAAVFLDCWTWSACPGRSLNPARLHERYSETVLAIGTN